MFYYSTGEELRLDTPVHEFMSAAKNFGNQWYRHQVRTKTREAMRARAAKGLVAGGKVLGYTNVRDANGGNVSRVIDPAQAEIVRRVFALCAEGKGLLRIAKTLNEAGVPNPTGQDRIGGKKSAGLWASTGVREVLRRELYRGVMIYGKTRWQDRGGQTVKVRVPEAEWLRLDVPELRIVPEELWQAAHARLAQTHKAYLRVNGGRLNGKPESGLESKYLLSGFVRCDVCQGNMMVTKRTSQRGRPQLVYVCSTHRTRGDVACPENHAVPAGDLHDAVIRSFTRDILTPDLLEALVVQRLADAAEPKATAAERDAVQAEVRRVDAELKRLGDAVAAGAAVDTLLGAIKAREAERRGLLAKVAHLDDLAKAAEAWDRDAFAEWLRSVLPDWHTALTIDPQAGRRMLRGLLAGPIFLTRTRDGMWRYRGTGILGKVLSGRFGTAHVPAAEIDAVSELNADFEAESGPEAEEDQLLEPAQAQVHYRWCPRGDSNTRHAV